MMISEGGLGAGVAAAFKAAPGVGASPLARRSSALRCGPEARPIHSFFLSPSAVWSRRFVFECIMLMSTCSDRPHIRPSRSQVRLGNETNWGFGIIVRLSAERTQDSFRHPADSASVKLHLCPTIEQLNPEAPLPSRHRAPRLSLLAHKIDAPGLPDPIQPLSCYLCFAFSSGQEPTRRPRLRPLRLLI